MTAIEDFARFAVSVPEHYSLSVDGTRMALFKAAMRGIVPDEVLDRRDKIGFATPEQTWLDELAPWVDSVFSRARDLGPGPVDLPALEREWQSVRSGSARFDHHIWRCLNLFAWAERRGVSLEAA